MSDHRPDERPDDEEQPTDELGQALTVHAVKATIGDRTDRAVIGWLASDGRWWCETHGHRPCPHTAALAGFLEQHPAPAPAPAPAPDDRRTR